MDEQIRKDYDALITFWNSVFTMSDEDKAQGAEGIDPDEDWKSLAPSEKLLNAACDLGSRNRVLDYGCGDGWAGIAAAKSGCRNVVCADVIPAGIDMAKYYAGLLKTGDAIDFRCISTDWLSKEPDESYDGFICSNVLDVIPAEAAEDILRQAARVVTKDAGIVIGLNYCMEPEEDPEKHITVQYGNQIYVDGILRMVSRTDEEWTRLLEKYFDVVKLDHFAWPGEQNETRRLFFLKKKG
ncbi:MAG: hypothetical protein CW338_04860 [Clostridiales bacterium]|nr:hypothetical protein [Clostridiales bacterium]